MTITQFIGIVAPKLKPDSKLTYEVYKGSDLKLTAYKDAGNGKPIQDHKLYKVPVPVHLKTDHHRKMKLAWLRGGRNAVRTYLHKYVKTSDLNKIMSVLQ
jgi:hypothetical protein